MSDEEDYSSGSDEDYVPSDGEAVSEEECSGDEEDLDLLKAEGGEDVKTSGKRKRKKKPDILQRKRKGGIKLEGELVNKAETEEEMKARKELEENIKEEQKQRKEEQEKKKADDLWSSFMSDVGTRPKKASPSPSVTSPAPSGSKSATKTEVKASDSTTTNKKITITKEYDFAGEIVKVTKEVDQNSKEAQSELKKQESVGVSSASPGLAAIGIKRPGGLGSVLDKINKKQKISTLNKSKLDWDQFKKDNKLEEDLTLHNKGKLGYLERQAFLNRTEQREFVKERDLRLSQSSKR
ncbi:craniofacial development protein 1-like [Mytilus galloprovincialis]|uniref:craniofacial development protein 1-like n=1 Tax=Mytilus galloprovincialis TaxID=29158 RepID=UPI003F7CC798